MVDALFGEPRLAAVYDALDPDRGDLEHYAAIVAEFGATKVLDVGCGTGELGCLLAGGGVDVVGVDPAEASLEVARGKEFAERVRWIQGDATTLPLQVDLALMTGNVAQVFLTDEEWSATVRGVRAALIDGGRFVFETRVPARRQWEEWTRENTHQVRQVAGGQTVEAWGDLLSVELPFVTFRSTYVFSSDGAVLTSQSVHVDHPAAALQPVRDGLVLRGQHPAAPRAREHPPFGRLRPQRQHEPREILREGGRPGEIGVVRDRAVHPGLHRPGQWIT